MKTRLIYVEQDSCTNCDYSVMEHDVLNLKMVLHCLMMQDPLVDVIGKISMFGGSSRVSCNGKCNLWEKTDILDRK